MTLKDLFNIILDDQYVVIKNYDNNSLLFKGWTNSFKSDLFCSLWEREVHQITVEVYHLVIYLN